jgi:geranylgeranyl pyrophosphate synthase
MLDDLLDVISPEEKLGKRPGTDIRERKPSLINILWLESDSPLAEKLRKEPGENEEEFVQKALAELADSSIIGTARLLARQEVEAADMALHEAVGSASSQGIQVCQDALGAIKAIMRYTLERME